MELWGLQKLKVVISAEEASALLPKYPYANFATRTGLYALPPSIEIESKSGTQRFINRSPKKPGPWGFSESSGPRLLQLLCTPLTFLAPR
jgi:hypothetical protein